MSNNETRPPLPGQGFLPERTITDTRELAEITSAISNWSNSIPNHDLMDLGSKITIVSATEKPSYFMAVDALTEHRNLSSGSRPYRGENIPPVTVTRDMVDVWSYNTTPPSGFQNATHQQPINGTEEINRCGSCGGHGELICGSCNGSRVNRCSSCNGQGEVRCSSCNGRGENNCIWCFGKGINSNGERCTYCSGRGFTPCDQCRGGIKNCSRCAGRGEVTCDGCDGRGVVRCRNCGGEGRLIEYLYFDDTFTHSERSEWLHHSSLGAQTINVVNEMQTETRGEMALEVDKAAIQSDDTDCSPYSALSAKCLGLVVASQSNDANSQNNRLLRQRLRVFRLRVVELTYMFLEKRYVIWLFGNGNKVYAPVSPISELGDNCLRKASDHYERGLYDQAHEFVVRTISLKQSNTDEASFLREKIEKKIRQQLQYGGLVGGLLGVVVTLLILALINRGFNRSLAQIYSLMAGVGIGYVIGALIARISLLRWKGRNARLLIPALLSTFASMLITVSLYVSPIRQEIKDFQLAHGAKTYESALLAAILKEKTDYAREFLKLGASVNARSSDGISALELSLAKKNRVIAQLLLDKGVSASESHNAVIYAVASDLQEFIEPLIKRGAEFKYESDNGKVPTALFFKQALIGAVFKQNVEIVETLLRNGADPNHFSQIQVLGSSSPETLNLPPLMLVAAIDANTANVKIIEMLCKAGADPAIQPYVPGAILGRAAATDPRNANAILTHCKDNISERTLVSAIDESKAHDRKAGSTDSEGTKYLVESLKVQKNGGNVR